MARQIVTKRITPIFHARIIDGVHIPAGKIVDVEESMANYLIGCGSFREALPDEKSKAEVIDGTFCTSCGTELSAGSKFCHRCGESAQNAKTVTKDAASKGGKDKGAKGKDDGAESGDSGDAPNAGKSK